MRKKAPKTIEYNPVCDPKHVHGYRGVRWVENALLGLRRVGFADEIMKGEGYVRTIAHRGWFIHDDEGASGEVYRGVVYQLPSRHYKPQYVYGYDDPNNDGAALLCFDPVEEKREAAKLADRFAEIFAEHERDYDRAQQARQQCEDFDERVKDARREALALADEMRRIRWPRGARTCAVIREKILSLYREIQKSRAERDELKATYGNAPGFEE